jgi:hypothetical protein
MRAMITVVGLGLAACGNAENAGAEEARRLAQAEQRAKEARAAPAKMQAAPVRGEAKIACGQLIDLGAFQTALGEKEPLELRDAAKTEPEAAAVCVIVRGGKRLTPAEQEAREKRDGRLGVLPGDELCFVAAYCSSRADPDRFRAACKKASGALDDSMGGLSCVTTYGVGAADVKSFRMLDDDTGCILQVRGGPSNIDNELIRRCARTARDTIGPEQIKVDPAAGSAK